MQYSVLVVKILKMPNLPEDYPDAYKEGKVEFFYLPFFTDTRALIPRLETEDLVREAIKIAKQDNFDTIVDIGSGSGIIGISVSKHVSFLNHFAIDISQEALDLTAKNAELHHIPILCLQGDLLASFSGKSIGNRVLFVTNLPYISKTSDELSSDTIYEPQNALFGGEETGFEMYERLFMELKTAHGVQFTSAEVFAEM